MSKDNKKIIKKNFLTVKLMIYDWGWADNILYRFTAKTSEKLKGVMMLQKIKEVFGISEKDVQEHHEEEIKAQGDIPWTKDNRGRIISPFSVKKKST